MPMKTRELLLLFLIPVVMSAGACLWQRHELLAIYPDGHIPYGHFRDNSAGLERQILIGQPVVAVGIAFTAYAIFASTIFFRRGARWRILLLLLWIILAYVPFGVYNFVLAGQGDGSVFI
jgi:hypothetical protein